MRNSNENINIDLNLKANDLKKNKKSGKNECIIFWITINSMLSDKYWIKHKYWTIFDLQYKFATFLTFY